MIKKITVLGMAICALAAMVAPGVASATKLTRKLVPIGTAITATANSTSIPLHTETEALGPLGPLECKNIMLNGEVTKNNGATVEAKGTAGGTATGCSLYEYSVTVSEIEIINLSSTEVGAETGTGKFSAKYSVTFKGLTCKLNTNGENGTFHFKVNTEKILITPTSVGNAPCGVATLEGEVALEKPEGTPVLLS